MTSTSVATGDAHPWFDHYPPGVPHDVNTSGYTSLIDFIDECLRKYSDRPAYVGMGRALSFAKLDTLSRQLGAYFQSLGLAPGDRIAIMMPNVLQYPVATLAVLRAGFIAVNVNPLYTPRELEHQLKDSGARAIVILENFAATLQSVLARTKIEHIVLASMGDLLGFPKGMIVNYVVRKKMVPAYSLPKAVPYKSALSKGTTLPFQKASPQRDDVAVLQYTGGTTGLSKGAMLTHNAVLAALIASDDWLKPALNKKPPKGQMNIVCALPLYHVFAFITCSLLGLRTGAQNILIVNPRDLPAMIKDLSKFKLHTFPAVNTLFNGLVNNADFAKLDFSELVVCNGGGTAVQESVAKKWLAVTGCPIVEGYGLSETCSGITCNPTDSDRFTGTIGLPMPGVDIRILDDDGTPVATGIAGEIAIKAPQVMAGYWQRPDETASSMTPDGYFKSGDVGVMDAAGFIKIVDRKKDMILVSGFNVYPNEIEAVAAEHPGVLECAAVGVPDSGSGEAVLLFVVRKDASLNEKSLIDFCRQNLTGYKSPKRIEFRDALPKTNVGKILRRELRDEALKENV